MKLENKNGTIIFPNKKWNLPDDEGYIKVQDTNEVLGIADETSGKFPW